jgi:UDP-GlcNAc:undecaprenyl-phosphate GlcNAc-1-phosphate transferase
MYALLFLAVSSSLITLLLTPVFRNLALRLGYVDSPDRNRKLHSHPIPRVGGVPIVLACILSVGLLVLTPRGVGVPVIRALPSILSLLPSVLVIFLTALLDDLISLKPWQKLAGQLAAAVLVCVAGVHVQGFGGHHLSEWLTFAVTILWLIACTNAFNLIDGVDGLATGVGLFATLTILAAGLIQGHYPLALATAPVAGALCGFLRYNFNPASIFLGDSGSLTLGFLLGAYGVIWSEKSATLLGMTAPLMALSIPLLDTTLAIARRLVRGQPIFGADRRHIHHLLLDRGLKPRRVALLLYGVCGVGATLSLLLSTVQGQYAGLVIVVFCASAWAGIQRLGYLEFHLAGRLIHPRTFRRVLDAQFRLSSLESTLVKASTPDECWIAVRSASQVLGFQHLSMRLDHTVYNASLNQNAPKNYWTLHIPLSETEFVDLGHGSLTRSH